ncbi:MAG TPA: twin-arginine translocase subunit TatC [Thermoguttaceae bacterium]|nr:twin-arginine translocase subunit TatC [Thermoguttaceae bacterium]
MRRKTDDDLFRESTMTFGEHLEDLRSCLFKALMWLVGGFLIGLIFARPAVHFIQGPLEGALEEHYKEAAKKRLVQMEAKGLPLPGTAEQLAQLVADHNVLPEEAFLDPSELQRRLQRLYADAGQRRAEAAKPLQDADRLLGRLQLPAADPKRKLEPEERDKLVEGIRLLHPSPAQAKDSTRQLTQEDVDRIAEAIEGEKDLPKDDLTRLAGAIKRQEERLREDLARIAQATELLRSTQLPVRQPHEELQRDDLARIFIWRPIENDRRIQTKALNVPEAFMIWVKAAMLVGVLAASPGIFWHIWAFVHSGLYYHERRFVKVFGPFSLMLFFLGAAVVFFFVFRVVLRFLFTFNDWLGIGIEPRITEWLGFVLILPLGFGIAFQLPLVMLFLERIGVFDVHAYLSKWRIAILVIFVLSMLLTPADPGSMLMMAIPLTILYFGGILLCRFMPRSRSPYDEEEEREEKKDKKKEDGEKKEE